jgi:hypothetical protein
MLRQKAKEHICEVAGLSLTESARDSVRKQLQRMLVHPLFRSGRRCPALFQYVVEQALENNTALLKERIIGIEVFGRTPDYDTNADSVVRTAAAELRKRIAQYYQETGHEGEVRIEIHSGSYVPDFRFLPESTVMTNFPAIPPPLALPEAPARPRTLAPSMVFAGFVVCLAAALVIRPWHPASSLDKFWSPVVASPGTALLYVGQRFERSWAANGDSSRTIVPSDPSPPPDVPLFKFYWMASQNMVLPDVIAISKLSGVLQAKGKAFRILPDSDATFDDSRGGPAILIGGYRNDWITRLMSQWRFHSTSEGSISWIEDRHNPTRRNWTVNFALPYTSITEDYALVSHAVDPSTGRPIIAVAGVSGYGTMAAAEFVTDAAEIREIEKLAPANWERKGFQLVLKTNVIGKSSGPPHVVASQFW